MRRAWMILQQMFEEEAAPAAAEALEPATETAETEATAERSDFRRRSHQSDRRERGPSKPKLPRYATQKGRSFLGTGGLFFRCA